MRLRRALEEFVIAGIDTTIPLHQRLVAEPDFINGDYDIALARAVPRIARERHDPTLHARLLLLRAYAAGHFPDGGIGRGSASCSGSIPSAAACCRSTASTCRAGCAGRCGTAASRSRCDRDFAAVIARLRRADGRSGRRPGSTTRSCGSTPRCTASGYAHSVEAWHDGELVGGLYGVALGGAFFGESMFSRVTDASKVALAHLVARLRHRRLPAARHAVRDRASGAVRRDRDLARAPITGGSPRRSRRRPISRPSRSTAPRSSSLLQSSTLTS